MEAREGERSLPVRRVGETHEDVIRKFLEEGRFVKAVVYTKQFTGDLASATAYVKALDKTMKEAKHE